MDRMTQIREDGNNVIFYEEFTFHKCFVNYYRNRDVVSIKRDLRRHYTKKMQSAIYTYLKHKNIV